MRISWSRTWLTFAKHPGPHLHLAGNQGTASIVHRGLWMAGPSLYSGEELQEWGEGWR